MFQKVVNIQPAPGVVGDFASANPIASVLSVPGGLVADLAGVIVGNMAFANPNTGIASSNYTAGDVIGFVHRENQALITVFLQDATLVVPQGLMVTLHDAGEFWGKFVGGATLGQKVFANVTGGALSSAVAGATPGQGVTANTSTATAGVLTVVTMGSGTMAVGQIVTGGTLPANTRITAQLSGTPGGAGTYQLSNPAAATAAAVVTGTLNVETQWSVGRTVLANEIAPITTWMK